MKNLGQVLPQAAQLPRTSDFFKGRVKILGQVLPQAAQLPQTSDYDPSARPQIAVWGDICSSGSWVGLIWEAGWAETSQRQF